MSACPKCGTHPSDLPHDTLGGSPDCLRTQALALGAPDLADTIDLTRDWASLAQANALGLPLTVDDVWADRA